MMENLINFNWINTYFGVCLICWLVSIIATLAIVVIKPLRKWYINVCYRWGKTLGEDMIDVMEDDINEMVSSLDEILVKKEEKEEEDENLQDIL